MNTGTVLDDQRIADIRGRVMADVEADVRRRSRRARVVAAGAVAGVVVIGLGAGLTAAGNDPAPTGDFSAAPAPEVAPEAADDSGYRSSTPDATGLNTSEADPSEQAEPTDRSVVTTGTAALVVDDPADAATDFGTWVETAGGRIDNRSDQSGRTGLTVRVPAGGVNSALDELRTLGELESSSIDRLDVTSQVVDLDARIAALQASIARLTTILNQATTTGEVVEAEGNLTQRQAELDGLVAQRTAIGEDVDLSTLTVTFSETPTTASVEPDGFLGGLRTGWNSLVESVNGIVTAAGVAAPWLGVIAVLAGGAWVVSRRRRKA